MDSTLILGAFRRQSSAVPELIASMLGGGSGVPSEQTAKLLEEIDESGHIELAEFQRTQVVFIEGHRFSGRSEILSGIVECADRSQPGRVWPSSHSAQTGGPRGRVLQGTRRNDVSQAFRDPAHAPLGRQSLCVFDDFDEYLTQNAARDQTRLAAKLLEAVKTNPSFRLILGVWDRYALPLPKAISAPLLENSIAIRLAPLQDPTVLPPHRPAAPMFSSVRPPVEDLPGSSLEDALAEAWVGWTGNTGRSISLIVPSPVVCHIKVRSGTPPEGLAGAIWELSHGHRGLWAQAVQALERLFRQDSESVSPRPGPCEESATTTLVEYLAFELPNTAVGMLLQRRLLGASRDAVDLRSAVESLIEKPNDFDLRSPSYPLLKELGVLVAEDPVTQRPLVNGLVRRMLLAKGLTPGRIALTSRSGRVGVVVNGAVRDIVEVPSEQTVAEHILSVLAKHYPDAAPVTELSAPPGKSVPVIRADMSRTRRLLNELLQQRTGSESLASGLIVTVPREGYRWAGDVEHPDPGSS